MKIIYSHLQKLLPSLKDVPVKDIANRLTYLGHFNDGLEVINGQEVISLEIRQNRGETLGYFGLASDLAVLYPPLVIPKANLNFPAINSQVPISIQTPDVTRIQSIVISNLTNSPSPSWLVEFLSLHEVNSINTLVDLTNYIMFLYGLPCHAFDTQKIGSPLTWQNNSGEFKKFTTLDGTSLNLSKDNIVVTSQDKVDSLAFIGGQNCAINLSTTETLLEMAVYNRSRVKADSRSLKTITEASIRLDKELDTKLIPQAFSHLISLVLEHCGGQISTALFDHYPQKPTIRTITFNPSKVSQIAGIDISSDYSLAILKKLGCKLEYQSTRVPEYYITPPTYRKDLNIEEDLVEEVIRFYGYDQIPSTTPIAKKQVPDITPQILLLIESLKDKLVSLGYDEVRSWTLVSDTINPDTVVATQNSINSNYPYLRQSITQSLQTQLQSYNKYKLPNPQFFEIGKIFSKKNGNYIEKYALGLYHPSIDILKKDLKSIGLNPNIITSSFAEIILDDLDISSKNLQTDPTKNNPKSIIELTHQITTLDANVTYPQKVDSQKLIDDYTAKIGDNLWQIDITDIYHNQATNTYKYSFRVSYFNLPSLKAKQLHLTTFNLADANTLQKLSKLTIDKNQPTIPLYYQDMYQTSATATVIDIKQIEGQSFIILDQTLFFPEGGGQPSDIGVLKSSSGQEIPVVHTKFKNNQVWHLVKANDLSIGDSVSLDINWDYRYKYMKIHSAGHLLHEVLMANYKNISALKGYHHDDAYLIYQGQINSNQASVIEKILNQEIKKDISIICRYTDYQELSKLTKNIPKNLPTNKKLRLLQIGDYPVMPDGGIQVKSTKEIGSVKITEISENNNQTTIKYTVV